MFTFHPFYYLSNNQSTYNWANWVNAEQLYLYELKITINTFYPINIRSNDLAAKKLAKSPKPSKTIQRIL